MVRRQRLHAAARGAVDRLSAAERELARWLAADSAAALDGDMLAAARHHSVHLIVAARVAGQHDRARERSAGPVNEFGLRNDVGLRDGAASWHEVARWNDVGVRNAAASANEAVSNDEAARHVDAVDMSALSRELLVAAAGDAAAERHTVAALAALASAGVECLLFKGAALAYTIYAAPHLRPRTDVDILVAPRDVTRAEQALLDVGWRRALEPDADLASAQRHYTNDPAARVQLQIDLHWRVANPIAFGAALSFDDLRARSVPLPALGDTARAPSAADALLIACMHRVAHHADRIELLWLWDVHLLLRALDGEATDGFVAAAGRGRMTAVCARGIDLAGGLFGTPGAAAIAERLHAARCGAEPSADFIGGLSTFAIVRTDLLGLPNWRARARMAAEHVFPSRAYMRARYPRWPAAMLPLAYADRVVRGAPAWFRRSR